MAYRTAAGRASKPLLVAPSVLVAAGAGLALYPSRQTMRAEGAPAAAPAQAPVVPVVPSSSAAPRLSIYDAPSSPIVLAPEQPSALQMQVSSVRKTSEVLYNDARARLRGASNQFVGLERKVEHEMKSIIPADEPLTPGALYIGISTLLGSIITRSRSFPIRFLSPPLALLASSSYFLPKTSHNVSLYIAALEKAYIPSVYEQQVRVGEQAKGLWRQVRGQVQDVGEKAGRAAEGAAGRLKEQSGLKLQQAERQARVDDAAAASASTSMSDRKLV